MKYVPDRQHNDEVLDALFEQIERAWNARKDPTLVDRFAAEHPEHADALYDFYILLAQAEIELDQSRPELAPSDARIKSWLKTEGFARAAIQANSPAILNVTATSPLAVPEPLTSPTVPASPSLRHESPDGDGIAAGPLAQVAHAHAADSSIPERPAIGPPAGAPDPRARARQPSSAGPRFTFLGMLRRETRLPTATIAADLDVDTNFLVGVDGLGPRLPAPAREELARRVERKYAIPCVRSREHLGVPGDLAVAASRTGPYGGRPPYEALVRASAMTAEQKALWLALVAPPPTAEASE
jgi:hypothetical protein